MFRSIFDLGDKKLKSLIAIARTGARAPPRDPSTKEVLARQFSPEENTKIGENMCHEPIDEADVLKTI